MMKKLRNWLKNFFFPPAKAPRWVRVLPYAVLGLMTGFVLIAGAYGWQYTNSPEFCGSSCHTMPPEYSAYLASPHARVACVDCHIGEGFIATQISRKAGDMRHIFATVFTTYEYPIRAHKMRPARESCELCHSPEKFSDDSLREMKSHLSDKSNTPFSIYLTLKTGGGLQRQGLGRGIHWHIENPVLFYATDDHDQNIPYIKVKNPDGSVDEYIDIETDFDLSAVAESELIEMDCITCHNRISHKVLYPADMVDQLLSRGLIDNTLPDVRRIAIEIYDRERTTLEAGITGMEGIASYYQTYYPEIYNTKKEEISSAIKALQDAYKTSAYPEQKSDWNAHPNNIGHKNSPGCFRCHDGKHLNAKNEAIRLECNLCHSVPVVAGPNNFVSIIEISRGPIPESHVESNWISMHHLLVDASCANCHTTDDPGGTSNTSFCSNPACHGSAWEYAGFDAPKLRETILAKLPTMPTPQPTPSENAPLTYKGSIGVILQTRCGSCHGQEGMLGLNITTYSAILDGSHSGAVIIPGDPENSLLISKLTGETPHFSQLTTDELELLSNWISAGAPE